MKINRMYNEDCTKTLGRMKDKSVDYVITSPPYNFGKDNIHLKDSKYIEYKDNLSQKEYFEWQKSIIRELLRVTKKHIFYNIQLISGNKIALFKLIGYFAENIKEIIIWDKIRGEPAMLPGVLNSVYEFIIIFSNDSPEKRVFSDTDWRGTEDNILRNKKNYDNKMHNFAIMPLNVPRKILQTWGKEGDLIYDPFAGSFTTAVACITEGRDYLGSELSKYDYDKGIKRLNIVQSQKRLF